MYHFQGWSLKQKNGKMHLFSPLNIWCWVNNYSLFFLSHKVIYYSLQTHGLQHASLPCPSLSPRVGSNSSSLSQWCHPIISSSVIPLSSCLQYFPVSGSFPMSWLFTSGSQRIGASVSASVLPMNIQGWFPFGLTGLISLLPKWFLSLLQNHNSKVSILQPSLWSKFISVHDYWKNHSFDYLYLCWQSDVSTF